MKSRYLLILLIAVLAFASCTKKKTTEPPDANAVIVSSSAVLLTEPEAGTITDITAEQIVFTGNLVTAAKFPAGKIIVSRPAAAIPNGLLRKVLSASEAGNVVTVVTTSATLEEVFTQADFETETPLTTSDLRYSNPLMEGVMFTSNERNPERFSYSISHSMPLGGGINLIAYGSISLTHSFNFHLHKHKTEGITALNFKYMSEQSNSMSFSVNGFTTNGAFDYSTDLDMYEQVFNPIVLMVGTVPVVVTPKVLVKLHIDVDGEGNVTCSLNSSADYSTELDYQKPTWTTTNDKSITYTHNAPTIAQPVNVIVGSGARLSLMFYGESSPYTEAMSYLNLTSSNTAVPWWTLGGRFRADTGLLMTPIGAGNSHEAPGLIDESVTQAQAVTTTCADPEFSPAPGTYDGNHDITINTATSGAQIRYTLDGTEPLQSSTLYTDPIFLTSSTTIKAKVFKIHVNPSPTATAAYVINPLPTVEIPTFNPAPGTYPDPQSVTISCATEGAVIHYTTNGGEPTSNTAIYSGPITVNTQMNFKARAYKTGCNASPLATAAYNISNIQTVADPQILPPGGNYNGAQNVSIFCTTDGAQIRYTLDGTDPTETSTLYTNAIAIDSPTTLKVRAYKAGWISSQMLTEVYNYTIYEVGSINTPGIAKGVVVTGNYALVADYDGGLRVIDVTNPASPALMGNFSVASQYAFDVVLNGGNAYVAYGSHGLSVVNFSNPNSPTELGVYTPEGEVRGVAINGNNAYLANFNHGIRFANVASPTNITPTGLVNPNGTEERVVAVGTTVYCASTNHGLRIIDATVPAVPVELGYYLAPGVTYDVAVSGNYAYLGTSQGLRIVNISAPNQPVAVGFLSLPDAITGLKIRGNYAYLADGIAGLKIVDISNPASPVVINTFNTPDSATDVFVNGDYAYVADGSSGLRIIFVGNRNLKRK